MKTSFGEAAPSFGLMRAQFPTFRLIGIALFTLLASSLVWRHSRSSHSSPPLRKPAGETHLIEALYSEGAVLQLVFDQPVDPLQFDLEKDLKLTRAGDTLGSNPQVAAKPYRNREGIDPRTVIEIVLGRGVSLNLYNTYRPKSRGSSPSLIQAGQHSTWLAESNPVPILVSPHNRISFMGDRYPVPDAYKPYLGHLHSHTRLSDGKLLPKDAYARARRHGLDFYAVTDHMEYLNQKPWRWRELKKEAEAPDEPGKFVAIYGFEWGGYPSNHGWMNHMNIIESPSVFPFFGTVGLAAFYHHIAGLKPPSFAVFNHPAWKRFGKYGINNWNHFSYNAVADKSIRLIRVENHLKNPTNNQTEEVGYIPALDQGWHVAPEVDEDNHQATWGNLAARVGVWAKSLTQADIIQGLYERATFFADSAGKSVKIIGDDRWMMGSTLYGEGPHTLTIEVNDSADPRQSALVELVTVGGEVSDSFEAPLPIRRSITVNPQEDSYFYVRVTERHGGHLISAPLFIDR